MASSAVRADAIADFYRGKQINWILSAGAGGGYSSYALAFAPYFSAHIPGQPKIVVQNMPGAGGIRASVYLLNHAPRDGSVIGMVHSSVPFAPLFGISGATFDPLQASWIGSLDSATSICVAWHASKIKTWQDILAHEFTVGGSGAGSQMETTPAMLARLFGAKIKVISGYKSGNEIYLAMERGEVDGRCGGLISSINSTRPDWFARKKVNIPIQVALKRDRMLPDVPAIGEFIKDEHTRQIMQLFLAPQDMDRPLLTPPGVPPERLAALRAAFHAAINDPAFLAEAKKQHLHVQETTGEEVAEIVARTYAMPPEIAQAVHEAMTVAPPAAK